MSPHSSQAEKIMDFRVKYYRYQIFLFRHSQGSNYKNKIVKTYLKCYKNTDICSIALLSAIKNRSLRLIRNQMKYHVIVRGLKDPPPPGFLYDDCTRNHTVLKYMSYGVNFWKKSLMYQEGIYRIILWKFLFLANCIVRNQQL